MCTDTCGCADTRFQWSVFLVWGTALLLLGALYWYVPQTFLVVLAVAGGVIVHTWWTVDLPRIRENMRRKRAIVEFRQKKEPMEEPKEPFDLKVFVKDALRAFKRLGFVAVFAGVLVLFYGGLWKAGTVVASLFI